MFNGTSTTWTGRRKPLNETVASADSQTNVSGDEQGVPAEVTTNVSSDEQGFLAGTEAPSNFSSDVLGVPAGTEITSTSTEFAVASKADPGVADSNRGDATPTSSTTTPAASSASSAVTPTETNNSTLQSSQIDPLSNPELFYGALFGSLGLVILVLLIIRMILIHKKKSQKKRDPVRLTNISLNPIPHIDSFSISFFEPSPSQKTTPSIDVVMERGLSSAPLTEVTPMYADLPVDEHAETLTEPDLQTDSETVPNLQTDRVSTFSSQVALYDAQSLVEVVAAEIVTETVVPIEVKSETTITQQNAEDATDNVQTLEPPTIERPTAPADEKKASTHGRSESLEIYDEILELASQYSEALINLILVIWKIEMPRFLRRLWRVMRSRHVKVKRLETKHVQRCRIWVSMNHQSQNLCRAWAMRLIQSDPVTR
jgi:hypothetical protein